MAVTADASKKKGQVAMEYLITYGWAIVLIIVIMAILYSTVFKPEFYVAESCNMAPGLDCNPATTKLEAYGEGASLAVKITNMMDFDITLNSLEFVTEELAVPGAKSYYVTCSPSCAFCSPNCDTAADLRTSYTLQKGNSSVFGMLFKGEQPTVGRLYRVKLILNYTIVDTGTNHRTAGILNVRGS